MIGGCGIGRGVESVRQQSGWWRGDPQERVQEPTVEQATTAAEVGASTVVESVDGCEDRPHSVEVSEFVCQDRIQQLAFEQPAGFSEVVEESVLKVVSQDQFLDIPVTRVKEQVGGSAPAFWTLEGDCF